MGDIYGVPGTSRWPLKAHAALTSLLLSVLFMVVYSSTNWISSLRTDVGTWYYEWERWIPFVPWMVVPYMSIDLFFVAAPFLMRDRTELRTFARRVTLAILVAGAFFLIMPLRLSVQRPRLEGWLGAMFGWFFTMDQPFNLCPSLHIALRTLLAETFAKHTRGVWNAIAHAWFSLIGLSTLLTYQHHMVDVVGGFLLATVCFYAIPTAAQRYPVTLNRRIGAFYALSAMAAICLAIWFWPWGGWIVWPASACLIVAAGYVGLIRSVYRKTAGIVPVSARLVLAPVLAGHYASWWYYGRQCRRWDEIVPNVWIGRQLDRSEADEGVRRGIRAVLDLTAEFSEPALLRRTSYFNVPILDLTAPTPEQLDQCVQFMAEHVSHGVVYVHCKAGYSRSAAVVGSFLMSQGFATDADDAMRQLRRVRPSIVIRSEAEAALRAYALRVSNTSHECVK